MMCSPMHGDGVRRPGILPDRILAGGGRMVDVARSDIALETHKRANAMFYQEMLEVLQAKAAELGYVFVAGVGTGPVPCAVTLSLGRAVVEARLRHLEPLTNKSAEEMELWLQGEDRVGYTTAWAEMLLTALAGQGFRLQRLEA